MRFHRSFRPTATMRDEFGDMQRCCGIDDVVVLAFNKHLAALPLQGSISRVLQQGLAAKYVPAGDDFRLGATRAGTYNLLDEGMR
jgi:riboflavin kinase/FMN adenylyltransferase